MLTVAWHAQPHLLQGKVQGILLCFISGFRLMATPERLSYLSSKAPSQLILAKPSCLSKHNRCFLIVLTEYKSVLVLEVQHLTIAAMVHRAFCSQEQWSKGARYCNSSGALEQNV